MARSTAPSARPVAAEILDEGESEAFLPYPELGDQLENVPIYVRAKTMYYIHRMAFLPNCLKLYLYAPWISEPLFDLNDAVMRDERNQLPEQLKARLTIIASRTNECEYCTAHNALTLARRWDYDANEIEDVLHLDGEGDERQQVAMEFVHQASLDAAGVTDELRSRLAELFTPQEVIEIVTLVGFWKMYNTMHTAMAVPLEEPITDYHKSWLHADVGRPSD